MYENYSVICLLCAERGPDMQEGNCTGQVSAANDSASHSIDCDHDGPRVYSSALEYIQNVVEGDVRDTDRDGQSNMSHGKSQLLGCRNRLPPDNSRQRRNQTVRETAKVFSADVDSYVGMSASNSTSHLPECNDHRLINDDPTADSRQGRDHNVHEIDEVLSANIDSDVSVSTSNITSHLPECNDSRLINVDRQGCDQNVREIDEVLCTNTDSYSKNCTSNSITRLLNCDDRMPAVTDDGRRFPCVLCNKLIHVYRLTRHMRTHTGDRPYCCDVCGRRFLESRHLVEHARTHSGDRPFACYVCSQQFGRAGNL